MLAGFCFQVEKKLMVENWVVQCLILVRGILGSLSSSQGVFVFSFHFCSHLIIPVSLKGLPPRNHTFSQSEKREMLFVY